MDRVLLRDGATVLIRPIRADDKAALEEGLERLSTESRYKRFFSPVPRFTAAQLRYLTEIDHHDHEALVALSPTARRSGSRATFATREPEAAEAAVVVVDDWHNRGVATELLTRLAARAGQEGINRFTATALAQNREALDLLRDLGPAQTRVLGDGTVEMRIELPVTERRGTRLWRTLRRAAEGRLAVRDVGSRVEEGDPS